MTGQGRLRGTTNISERPAEANDRAVPGHWEGDLLFGKGMSAVATLVERKSRFVMLIGLPHGHSADVVADTLAVKITELPDQAERLRRRAITPIRQPRILGSRQAHVVGAVRRRVYVPDRLVEPQPARGRCRTDPESHVEVGDDLDALYADRTAAGLAASTVGNIHALLSACVSTVP
jgi:hypothetical protein